MGQFGLGAFGCVPFGFGRHGCRLYDLRHLSVGLFSFKTFVGSEHSEYLNVEFC